MGSRNTIIATTAWQHYVGTGEVSRFFAVSFDSGTRTVCERLWSQAFEVMPNRQIDMVHLDQGHIK